MHLEGFAEVGCHVVVLDEDIENYPALLEIFVQMKNEGDMALEAQLLEVIKMMGTVLYTYLVFSESMHAHENESRCDLLCNTIKFITEPCKPPAQTESDFDTYELEQKAQGVKAKSKEDWHSLRAASLKGKGDTYYTTGVTMYKRGYFEEGTHTGLAISAFVPPDKQLAIFSFWIVPACCFCHT